MFESAGKGGKVAVALMSHRVSIVKRSAGKSAVGSLAYLFGKKLKNELTGTPYNYCAKQWEVVYADILLPKNAPERLKDAATFAHEIEQRETREDAQLLRSVFFALPRELTTEQHIALVKEIAQISFVSLGMCAAVAIHDKGDGNPHCHVRLTLRTINQDKTFGNKCREWNDRLLVKEWMLNYQDITNKHLEQAGCSERIDVRSYEERGIDQEPTVHLGHYAHLQEQQGIASERGNINREIEARNTLRAEINAQLAVLEKARKLELARLEEIIQEKTITQEDLWHIFTAWQIQARETLNLEAAKQEAAKLEAARAELQNSRKLAIAQLFTEWKSMVQENPPAELQQHDPVHTLRTILGTCCHTLNNVQHRLVEAAKKQLAGMIKQLGNRKEAICEKVTQLEIFHCQSPAQRMQDDVTRMEHALAREAELIAALREKVAAAEAKNALPQEIPASIQKAIRDLQQEENQRQSAAFHRLEPQRVKRRGHHEVLDQEPAHLKQRRHTTFQTEEKDDVEYLLVDWDEYRSFSQRESCAAWKTYRENALAIHKVWEARQTVRENRMLEEVYAQLGRQENADAYEQWCQQSRTPEAARQNQPFHLRDDLPENTEHQTHSLLRVHARPFRDRQNVPDKGHSP